MIYRGFVFRKFSWPLTHLDRNSFLSINSQHGTDRMARFRFRIQHLLGFTAVVAFALCSGITCHHVSSTRTIIAIDLPQNKRIRLIQDFGGEPFDTQLYFDAGDGRWGFYYYEHEDWYWNNADAEMLGDTIHIIRDGRCTIRLDTHTGLCVVDRADGFHREYAGPVSYSDKPVQGLAD